MEKSSLKKSAISGVIWTFAEKSATQIVSFFVSIILARLLSPDEYGVIAIVTVFITFCDVIVSGGFSTSLIQKKEVDHADFSTVLYFEIGFSAVLYIIIYISAPLFAGLYKNDILAPVLRVMGLSVIISSLKSIGYAYSSRIMQFKKIFYSTLGGTVVSATVGIVMAVSGYGIWALVAQYLTNNIISTIILSVVIKWKPALVFSAKKLKGLLSFGWKILVSNIFLTVYQELRTLLIGTYYTSADLAYYNRGKQFPSLITTNTDAAISSTLLPVLSKIQDSKEAIKNVLKRSIAVSSYLLIPLLGGLFMVADSVVEILLTEKWMACVPFLRLSCVALMMNPINSANTQAFIASGRSDIALKAVLVKRGVDVLIILTTFRLGVLAIVIGELISAIMCLLINTGISKRLFNFGVIEQIKEIAPSLTLSCAMMLSVYCISQFALPRVLLLIIQITVGGLVYWVLSMATQNRTYSYIINLIKGYIGGRK